MDVDKITTRDMLEILGIDPEKGLPHRGKYNCYLEYGGYDVKTFNDDLLFYFRIEFGLQCGLHIGLPNGTISDICENSRTFHPTQNRLFIEYIHKKCNDSMNYPEDLVSVCFSVLHEFGHWEYFLDCDLSIEEYKNFDEPYREANRKMIASEKDKFLDYRKIPSEKAADKFAFSLLIDFMKQLLMRRE